MGPRRPRPWRREPPPLLLPAPSRGAGIRDGERLRAPGKQSRALPAPPHSRSRAPGRAQVPRGCGGVVADPLRGGGRGCPAPAAALRYPGPPLRPLINKRRCRRSPADLGTRSRPWAARCSPPAHGLKAPAAAGRSSLASSCRHCPEPARQPWPCCCPVRRACRAKDGPERRREVRRRCALAPHGRQAAALGAELAPAERGWPELPAPNGARARREGGKPAGAVLPKVKMLPCRRAAAAGRRRRQKTGGSWRHRAAPRSNLRAEPAAAVSRPAQGAMAALGTMDPAVRNGRNWGHLEYEFIGSASGFCQLQSVEPGNTLVVCTIASSLGRRVWNLNKDYYREAKVWFLQFL